MKISVIMPCCLEKYEGCAASLERKFGRAVQSFLKQTYMQRELLIISDGCEKTVKLFNKYKKIDCVKLIQIDKQPLFSGNVRQAGIDAATGEVISYLDADDIIEENHLTAIAQSIGDNDFIYYNDFVATMQGAIQVRNVKLEQGLVGTSSISHKNNKEFNWNGCDGYGHDWTFVEKIMKCTDKYTKVFGMRYIVCHIAKLGIDVG